MGLRVRGRAALFYSVDTDRWRSNLSGSQPGGGPDNRGNPARELMDLSDFNAKQREALLDLLVLASYLDRRLGILEDERVKRLLLAMGHEHAYDRQRLYQDSITRMRLCAETTELAHARASRLAKAFTTQAQCRQVCALLEELVSCDGQVTDAEQQLLDLLRDTFQI